MATSFKTVRNIGLSILVFLVLLVAFIPTWIVYRIEKPGRALMNEAEIIEKAIEIDVVFDHARKEFERIKKRETYNSEAVKRSVNQGISKTQELIEQLSGLGMKGDVPFMENLLVYAKRFKAAFMSYVQEYRYDPAGATTIEMEKILRESADGIHSQLNSLVLDCSADIRHEKAKFVRDVQLGQLFSLVGLVLALVAGPLIALYMGRALTAPIRELVKETTYLAHGNFDHKVVAGAEDEIGVIAHALDDMRIKLKEHEDQLVSERMKAERASQAKDILLGNASHELRTPLMAIMGYAEFLQKGDNNPEFTQKIYQESETLMNLINALLDVTRLQTGNYKVSYSTFDLHHFFDNIAGRFRMLASKRNLYLKEERSEDLPRWISSDPLTLNQIVSNFLSNAVKFTKTGGINLKFSVTERGDPQVTIRISVKDTGIGIPKEKQDYIFEEFKQLEEGDARSFSGFGLGLYIAKQLVEVLGGKIGVISDTGQGSEFWCELPVAVAKAEDIEKKQTVDREAAERASSVSASISPAHILVVDDYGPTRDVLTVRFHTAGYQVTSASSGQEAIDLCRNQVFDLILMDVQMPVIDGLATTKIIRQISEYYARVPIIALTARVEESIGRACFKAGMNDILPKPISPSTLVKFLDQFRTNSSGVTKDEEDLLQAAMDEVSDIIYFPELLKSFSGNREVAIKAVRHFVTALKSRQAIIRKALAADDLKTVQNEASKMTEGAAALAMRSLADISRKIESAAVYGTRNDFYRFVQEFDILVDRICSCQNGYFTTK